MVWFGELIPAASQSATSVEDKVRIDEPDQAKQQPTIVIPQTTALLTAAALSIFLRNEVYDFSSASHHPFEY